MLRSTVMALALMGVALLACKRGEQDERDADSRARAEAPAVPAEEEAAAPAPRAAEPKAASQAAGAKEREAAELALAAEPEDPIPEIPPGRSKPPTVAEWRDAKEVNTQEVNSQPDACQMKIVREWLKINCTGDVTHYSEMDEFGNENADYFKSVKPGKLADFVVRLRPGKTVRLKIHRRGKYDAALFVNWPMGRDRPVHVALGRSGTKD